MLVYFIPDVLYISSYVDITKTGSNMEYNLTSNSLLFNNLTNKQTAELLDAISAFTKEDFSAEYFNLEIGRAICSSLIGDETNEGLAYKLKIMEPKTLDLLQKTTLIISKYIDR